MILRCKDVLHNQQAYIIVLDDNDINDLLKSKELNDQVKINKLLKSKLDDLIM